MPDLQHPHSHSLPSDAPERKQLRLLAVAHLVVAGLSLLLLVLLVLLPMLMGSAYYQALHLSLAPQAIAQIKGGLVAKLINGGLQTLIFGLNGWSIKHHQNRISCLILSVFECLSLPPLGLILGVCAILLLRRESVKALFELAKSPAGVSE